jgi:cytosine/uracil/thiamine/allantoin permease
VPALYDPNGRYRFNSFGVNWRAAVALLFGITPNMYGTEIGIS